METQIKCLVHDNILDNKIRICSSHSHLCLFTVSDVGTVCISVHFDLCTIKGVCSFYICSHKPHIHTHTHTMTRPSNDALSVFIVYFHIQKDKIEIILSSMFFLTVGVSLFHTGQILHSYWFILAPIQSRNNHIPTTRQI